MASFMLQKDSPEPNYVLQMLHETQKYTEETLWNIEKTLEASLRAKCC